MLDEDGSAPPETPEAIVASPIVADGRVYVTSMEATYAIGKRKAGGTASAGRARQPGRECGWTGRRTFRCSRTSRCLRPAENRCSSCGSIDASGNFIREEKPGAATWAVDQLPGSVAADGVYAARRTDAAGFVKATVGGVTGQARVRVIPPLPWTRLRFRRQRRERSRAAAERCRVVDRCARQGIPAHGRWSRQGAGAAARRHRRAVAPRCSWGRRT